MREYTYILTRMSGTPWSLAIHFDTRHKSTVKPTGGIKDKMPSAVSVHVLCTCLQMLLSSSFIVLVSGFLFYLLVIFYLELQPVVEHGHGTHPTQPPVYILMMSVELEGVELELHSATLAGLCRIC